MYLNEKTKIITTITYKAINYSEFPENEGFDFKNVKDEGWCVCVSKTWKKVN